MRRIPSVDALIPALHLKGISTGDFTEALAAILGEEVSGLSATNIIRLKAGREADYKAWGRRDLSRKRYVYWWADGVYWRRPPKRLWQLTIGSSPVTKPYLQRACECLQQDKEILFTFYNFPAQHGLP
jgi:hypothetical protein